jgi:uncharacterized protein YndB with AHSA1/START domain
VEDPVRSVLRFGLVVVIVLGFAASSAVASTSSDRILRAEITVNAPVADVWRAWTTAEGIATFFAPKGRVDLRVDGTYDVWFNPSGGPGERGAEGMRILDVDPPRRLAFTWNAPPSIPTIRDKRTVVILDFRAKGDGATVLRFTQEGWGDGPDWDKAYDYFDRAWGAIVLPRLLYRFEKGPLDWNAPPDLAPVAPTIKVALARSGS